MKQLITPTQFLHHGFYPDFESPGSDDSEDLPDIFQGKPATKTDEPPKVGK